MAPGRTDAVIVGVNKAGTTSLFVSLSAHPDVAPSSVKETRFFLPARYGGTLPPAAEWDAYFADAGDRPVHLEATPSYFYGSAAVAEAMRVRLVDPHALVVLREPVERAISFFTSQKARLRFPADYPITDYLMAADRLTAADFDDPDNEKYMAVRGGCYADFLPGWLDVLGTDHVRIIDFGQLVHQQATTLHDCATWLGLDASRFPADAVSAENRTTGYKSRGFQRLALAGNDRLERVLRRDPALKRDCVRSTTGSTAVPPRRPSPIPCAPIWKHATRSRTLVSLSSSKVPGSSFRAGCHGPIPAVPVSAPPSSRAATFCIHSGRGRRRPGLQAPLSSVQERAAARTAVDRCNHCEDHHHHGEGQTRFEGGVGHSRCGTVEEEPRCIRGDRRPPGCRSSGHREHRRCQCPDEEQLRAPQPSGLRRKRLPAASEMREAPASRTAPRTSRISPGHDEDCPSAQNQKESVPGTLARSRRVTGEARGTRPLTKSATSDRCSSGCREMPLGLMLLERAR